jgi:HEAT repeat protein
MFTMLIHQHAFVGPVALLAIILSAAPGSAQSSDGALQSGASRGFATVAPTPFQAQDPADSLYRAAREALNDEDYRRASRLFLQITDRYPRSAYAAQALYFRAFALYRLGREADLRDALDALEEHKSRFPNASTKGDAQQLTVRIQGRLAQLGDRQSAEAVTSQAAASTQCNSGERDDVRSAAMDALLQMNSANALPIIKGVLARRDACSATLRKKAMFLLSQKPSSESESLIIDAIRNDPSMAVREDAIFWLGQMSSDRAGATLEELVTSSSDIRLREKALFSLSQQNSRRAQFVMRRIVESADSPMKLRESAVFQIGQHASVATADYLKELFGKLPRGETGLKKSTLFSLSQMRGFGNDRWLLDLAMDESQSTEVRKHALFCAGQNGVPGRELASLYDRVGNRDVKEQLIWVMSESRDPRASDRLVEIAKSDRDPEMRKKAIFWLGQKNDPRIRQILLDILKD